MQRIMNLAHKHELEVIEDCAQSIGASFRGRRAGSIGKIGCFSFYPTKNLGGMGDGGMLTTNDPLVADRLRLLANHGMRPRYYHQEVGINSRLDAIQAAILCAKMKQLETWTKQRQANAQNYQDLLTASGLADQVALPSSSSHSEHVWNQYTIRIPNGWRDNVRQQLTQMNVGTEVYYPIPLDQQICFSSLDTVRGHLPHTDRAAYEVLALPIFPELTLAEQEYVVGCLAAALQAQSRQYRMAA